MALPRICIKVETTFGDATPEVVSCYFNRLRPFPSAAHGSFLTAIADHTIDGVSIKPSPAEVIAAYADLFDAACMEVRFQDAAITAEDIDHRIKMTALNKLFEQWEAQVKE